MLDHRAQDRVARCRGFVTKGLGQRCYATFFGESNRPGRASGIPGLIPFFGCCDALWRFELETNTAHPHFTSIRIAPHVTEGVAWLARHLADGKGSTWLSEKPTLQKLRLGECREDALARSSEHSPELEFAIARLGELKRPGIAIPLQPGGSRFDGLNHEPTRPPLRIASCCDQSSTLENLEVL